MSKGSILQGDAAKNLPKLGELFKVLGDSTRLKIVFLLMNGACNVGEIAQKLMMEQSAISHQLRVLRHARLVSAEKQGKNVLYTLDDHHVSTLISQALEHVMHE